MTADLEEPTGKAVEDAVRRLGTGSPEQAIADLTAVANRAIIELHRIAREQARERRGQEDWGRWAKLANAVRGGVLQIATIRDSVKTLAPATADLPPSDTVDPDDKAATPGTSPAPRGNR